jgi:hypothetical protein
MPTEPETQVPARNPTGGCSLGCAGVFVLVGLFYPFLSVLGGTWEGGDMTFLPGFVGIPAFVIAHILAVIAILSNAASARRAGRCALVFMWGSIALVVVIGIIADIFFHHPRQEAFP